MNAYMKAGRVAYVALGSNLGSNLGSGHGSELGGRVLGPAETVTAGIEALAGLAGGAGVVASSLYETAPVGFRDQPSFVNAVACLRTELGPEALLAALLGVEREFGRVRAPGEEVRNGPRTLDLDLLMVDDLVLSGAALTLPHARLHERRFVLEPLAEIAPGLRHPVLGRTMAELLGELPDAGEQARAGVRRLDSGAPFAPAGDKDGGR